MALFQFGSGTLFGTNTDIANSTPRLFGTLQDVSLDISFDLKELYGRKQFPDDVARGKGKITGKAMFANIQGGLFNDLFFGQTNTAGSMLLVALDETPVGGIPTTPFQITVVNAAAFKSDLGVKFSATGLPLTRVASSPAAGQYSVVVATGVYTFAAADTGKGVLISYSYTAGGTIGNVTLITNQLMGQAPHFKIVLTEQYNGIQANLTLFQCIASKLSMNTKNEDYTIPEFDFAAFADVTGNVIQLDMAQ